MSDEPIKPLELTDEVRRWLRSPVQIHHFGECIPWAGACGIQKDDPQSKWGETRGRIGHGAFHRRNGYGTQKYGRYE